MRKLRRYGDLASQVSNTEEPETAFGGGMAVLGYKCHSTRVHFFFIFHFNLANLTGE